MQPVLAIRVDKWLWSVRLYPTRSVASDACRAGQVQINGQRCKPARSVRPGDIVTAFAGQITRTVKVLALPANRLGAKLVPQHLADLTPASEFAKFKEMKLARGGARPKGSGRPTKRERRLLGSFFGLEE